MKSIIQGVSIAVIACICAIAGYWHIQALNARIEGLERSLQNAVETLTDVRGAIAVQNTALKNWRASQERLEASQRDTTNRIEYVLKNSKGNARIVDHSVISELCNGTGRKYCIEDLRPSQDSGTSGANGTMQGTSPKG